MHTQKWQIKKLDGCVSSNGKPYYVSLKPGRVNKLLVNFLGGGASWNEETAQRPMTLPALMAKKEAFYIPHMSPMMLKLGQVGLLSAKDGRNPFHDWYILNIPYATADFHIGNADFSYRDSRGRGKILHHHGAKNAQAAIAQLKPFFSQTPDVLAITGSSAGAFGCLAHGANIAALYPACENITLYAEGANLVWARWPEIASDVWQVGPELKAYIKSKDLVFDLFSYARDHMPKHTRFLHAVSVWDEALTRFMAKMNHGKMEINEERLADFHTSLLSVVKKLEENIEQYRYYLTDYGKQKDGTTPHVFMGSAKLLYGKMQEDIALASWISKALETMPSSVGRKFTD